MQKLVALINALEKQIPNYMVHNELVSKESVGWHLQHTFLATQVIINAVLVSNASEYKYTFNKFRFLVFLMGKIPQGRAKAPERVQPRGEIILSVLQEEFKKTKEKVSKLQTALPNNYFPHPYFGLLDKQGTIKFLKIHTKHHLKIIKDIIAKHKA